MNISKLKYLFICNKQQHPRFDRLNDYKNNQMTYAKWEYGPYNYSMAYFKTTEEKERKVYDKVKFFFPTSE